MGSSTTNWDAELYEARHGFVWQFGKELLALLDPQPGERILDLGCGTGHLANAIASSGAEVVGIDSAPGMIAQARQNYPQLNFVLADAASLTYTEEFHAVFSNAALHWMLKADNVAAGIARSLRSGGRFVAELGGRGNIARIQKAIQETLPDYLESEFIPAQRTFYPSVAEYAAILEAHGLEIRTASLFDRPTPLDGPHGMLDWLRQFGAYYFESMPADKRASAEEQVVARLQPFLLRDGRWFADYRRLRISAVKR